MSLNGKVLIFIYMKGKIYGLIISLVLLLGSCAKEDREVCGLITNGQATVTQTGDRIYQLWIDNNKEYVSEYIYYSSEIGSYICLQF